VAVWCQQFIDGDAIDPEFLVAPYGRTDSVLLAVKAASADDKGWDVEWTSPTSFVARKVRWDPDQLCERLFEIR
jgi:hypothetical protein